MFRWYDYWIKGIENGVMDEPSVTVFVEGSRTHVTGGHWPPKDVEYKSLHLRPRGKLSPEAEPLGPQHAAPDGFLQAPLTVTDTARTRPPCRRTAAAEPPAVRRTAQEQQAPSAVDLVGERALGWPRVSSLHTPCALVACGAHDGNESRSG